MSTEKLAAIVFTYEETSPGHTAKIGQLKHVVKTNNCWIEDPKIPVSIPELRESLKTWYALTPEEWSKMRISTDELEGLTD